MNPHAGFNTRTAERIGRALRLYGTLRSWDYPEWVLYLSLRKTVGEQAPEVRFFKNGETDIITVHQDNEQVFSNAPGHHIYTPGPWEELLDLFSTDGPLTPEQNKRFLTAALL